QFPEPRMAPRIGLENSAQIRSVGEFGLLRGRPHQFFQHPEKQYSRVHCGVFTQSNRRVRRPSRYDEATLLVTGSQKMIRTFMARDQRVSSVSAGGMPMSSMPMRWMPMRWMCLLLCCAAFTAAADELSWLDVYLSQPILQPRQTLVETQIHLASRVKPIPPIA